MNKIGFDDKIKKADEALEYYYKKPDEEKAPSPPHEGHYTKINENGGLSVDNISAFIIPEFEIEETIKSVKYVVDGTYDGEDFLHHKLKRVIDNDVSNIAFTGQTEVTENDDLC